MNDELSQSLGARVSHLTWELVGAGPWICRCGKLVTRRGRGSDDGVVHHIDENRANNDVSNLEVMCGYCHRSLHHKDKPKSEDMKRRNSIANKGVKRSAETRERVRQAKLAWWAEHKAQKVE